MHFDVFTALTASTAVILILGGVLALFWRRRTSSVWLLWLALAYFATGTGNFLVIISPGAPKPAAFALGSAIFFLGFALIWQSIRVFEGRKPAWRTMAVLVVCMPCVFLVRDIHADPSLRVALVSLPLAGEMGLAGFEAWRGREEGLLSKQPLVMLLGFAAFVIAGRVPFGALASYPIGAQPANGFVVVVLIGGLMVVSIILATLVLSMSLERSEKDQRHLAATDPMTGLLNRRGLETACPEGLLPAGASLVVFDLDHFKQVNDSFGHAAGDALIHAFALICREELRQIDHAARLGGEEFALVLSRTDESVAMSFAERVRVRFSQTVVPIESGAVAGTTSGGVFSAPDGEPVWLNAAIAAADRAMYRAKAAGRNRVFQYDDGDLGSRSFDKSSVAPELQAVSA